MKRVNWLLVAGYLGALAKMERFSELTADNQQPVTSNNPRIY
jgi:hypothetical protein